MPYVPEFEWDLFVSYPRESDERDAYDFEWVNEFHRLLESEIKQRLASLDGPKIYFDRRNFGAADNLEIDLLRAARKSALFMPIVSPRFVAPGKFTLRELEAFCEAGYVNNRIVTIELLPVSAEEGRPHALCGPKRNNFFVREGKIPIKLNPRSEKHGDLYATQLQIVAEEIKELLQKMRRAAGTAVIEANKPFSGRTVLLAEKDDDIDHQWESIRAYLHDFGANILSADAEEPNDNLEEFKATCRANLDRADLFVQLLSPVDEANRWIEGKPSRAELQYNLAVNRARPIPLLQWRKPGIRPDTLKHWDRDLLDGPHVAALGLEEFKREIKKKMLELSAPTRSEINTSNKPYIFITADDADIKYAQELKEKAEGEKLAGNCEIIATKNRMKNFKEAIRITDVIVVLYGAGNPDFVDEWLRTYARKKASGEAKPPVLDAFCRAPPRKTDTQKLMGPMGSFHIFGTEDAFSANVIREILEELQRRKGHTRGVAAT
jgi:hypothetical protein